MRKMKEKLKNKSAEKKNSSQQAAKTNNSKENQTTSSSVVSSSQKKPERNTSKNQREEIDIFRSSKLKTLNILLNVNLFPACCNTKISNYNRML